ncbi:InlB B-repeat-containing protein [Lysinibacillus capsici]|uniref:InlB B-repeat-containing protein n=1 Tax=Lysinibacillus capsici TaxID=2115968 RepID=UPI0021532EA6|nr:InlB B-repeat-containing protein [Lysinibacillus capsici]MCR6524971.1 InlB B-repeat-containing protein [Lysinibacillus capsici]
MKIFSRLKIGILCICMIVLNLSSMTIVEVPRVSATTFPSSEDFESSDGVGTNPRIIGDWEFALLKIDGTLDDSNNSNNDIDDFYPTDKSLGMSGYPGIVTTASIKSIKGNFKLNSLRLESAVNEIVELKIEGYRDNTFVTGAVVINQYMPFEKIDVPLTGEPWQNIDEIRISRTDGVADIFVRIYHLDVSASVTSTEDLIPPEISNPSINVMNISNNSVTLNWLKATDNITSTEDLEYQIYQSTSNNIDTVSHIETNGIALGNYSKDIATFDIPDLLQNTTYYFNIIVKDAAGNKTAYTMVNVTTLKAYSVSFSVDGGSTVPAQTIAHGEKATEPPPPTKAGYTFVGWYTSSMGNTPFNFDTAITGATTIYAKWNPVTHTVSFDVDGGSTIPAQTIAHGEKATEPPSPTKVGHTFVGWYTSSTGNTPFNFDTAITGATIVYAKWNPLTYTVSFDVDGGNTIPAQTIAHGEKATEPPSPTKAGHTFVGWYTSSMGNTPFNFDTTITGAITIYAKWSPVTHTVSFDVDGGSTISAQTIAHGEKATEPPPPMKAGHTFVGWYTSSSGNTAFNFDTAITGATMIYAKWNPVTHTVSFDVDGGSTIPAQTIAHGEKATEPPPPTKVGHTFVGWYTSSTGNTPFNFDTVITGDTTIYAKWNPVTHTVSFDVDGGSTISAQTIAHGEKATEPPSPTKAGHTFVGWYTSSSGNTAFNFDTAITGDTMIYAKWNPVTHTVSFDVDGGSTIPAQTIAHGEKATEPPPPTKAGHTFVGWYTSSMGNTAFNFDTTITGDTMIYAKWNPVTVTHTVSFDVAGGSAVSNQMVVHEGKASQPTKAPTKAGYTFGGWYTSNAYTTPYNFNTAITANTVIYAKWINNNTGGDNTDPSPNPDSGSSTPSTNVEEIVVDVESGNGDVVSKTTIKRSKNVDNTMNDDVTLTAASATETIRKLKEQGNDKARIIIPDEKDQVNQVQVSIPKNVLSLLQNGAVHLEIVTDNVRIEVPKTSLEMFNENLYFRLVPIKEYDKQLEIEEQAKRETVVQQLVEGRVVKLLGRPMTIETNMQSRPVKLTLPLPTDLTDEQLANLAIFIEHSDGTKEVVRGKVVEYQKGIGLQFEVNKFSTFSILYLPEKEEVKEPITEGVTHLPYIQGYPDDTFRPNAPVTRAQMASMFARQLTGNAIPQAKATYTDTFQHDAKDAIEFAKEKGLFKGVTATNFNPNGFITRAQMATVAARWIEQQCVERPDADFCSPTSQSAVFKDVSVHHWARQAIDTVNAAEIMTGITADTFNPDGLLTRAQAVKVLNRLFERQVLIEDQTPLFKDVPKHHWAFYEIQEAAKK